MIYRRKSYKINAEMKKHGENLLIEAPKEDFLFSTVPRDKTVLSK